MAINEVQPQGIEARIISGMVRAYLVLIIPIALVCLVGFGRSGLYSSLYAMALVGINFFVTAKVIKYAASISPVAIMVGALSSFFFDLALLTAATLPVARDHWMDLVVFGVVLVLSHVIPVGVVAKRVTGSLAYDGLRPTWRRRRA